MINMKGAGSLQLTLKDGGYTDWNVTLDGEELYTLPSKLSPQETIDIRRIIEKFMDYAYNEGMKDMAKTKEAKIEQLLSIGNAQLDALVSQNEELASALERHVINSQPDY